MFSNSSTAIYHNTESTTNKFNNTSGNNKNSAFKDLGDAATAREEEMAAEQEREGKKERVKPSPQALIGSRKREPRDKEQKVHL